MNDIPGIEDNGPLHPTWISDDRQFSVTAHFGPPCGSQWLGPYVGRRMSRHVSNRHSEAQTINQAGGLAPNWSERLSQKGDGRLFGCNRDKLPSPLKLAAHVQTRLASFETVELSRPAPAAGSASGHDLRFRLIALTQTARWSSRTGAHAMRLDPNRIAPAGTSLAHKAVAPSMTSGEWAAPNGRLGPASPGAGSLHQHRDLGPGSGRVDA